MAKSNLKDHISKIKEMDKLWSIMKMEYQLSKESMKKGEKKKVLSTIKMAK